MEKNVALRCTEDETAIKNTKNMSRFDEKREIDQLSTSTALPHYAEIYVQGGNAFAKHKSDNFNTTASRLT